VSFPRYPSYKDSGVEWLGEVPGHWEVKRLKHNLRLLTEKTDRRDHPVALENIEGWTGRFIPTETEFEGEGIAFDAGDILFGKLRPYLAKAYRAESPGEAVGDFHVMRPRPDIDSRFAQYQILNREFIAIVDGSTFGSKMPRASWEFVGGMKVTTPPLAEQTAIAEFLDRETGKIDELVAEQRRLMELLKEKRQAVISHAVTRGLNPAAPLKPSGIEWLGDVPAHWNIERGRFLFRKLEIPPEPEDGVVTAFRDGQVTLRANRRTDGFTMAVLEVGYQRVRAGDLVIHGMDAFAGAIGVSESTGKCTPEYSVMTPTRPGIDNRYYAMILRLMAQRNYIFVICPSVRERAPRFRFEAFKDVHLPVPPIEEQQEIMRMIESISAETIALTAEAQRAIDLLQERRTALISAAVTGQIDVRPLTIKKAA
jgi:type I restriction enzyme S subunit